MLHANELPLRHLFKTLDGATSGPVAFSGPIVKALATREKLLIIPFQPIFCDFQHLNPKKLNKGQRYLYEICHAVTKDKCSIDLSLHNPGPLNHSSWKTATNQLLRLYVAMAQPSQELVKIVTFVMTVYASTWFLMRINSCKDGAKRDFSVN